MQTAKRISEAVWAKQDAEWKAAQTQDSPKPKGYHEFLSADQLAYIDWLYNEVTSWLTSKSDLT